MTPTATGTRIRWEPLLSGNYDGYTGTRTAPMFNLFLATPGTPTPWALRSELLEGYSTGTSPDDLQAEAERWLEEFVSSLGAVFPETRDGERRCPRDHKRWGRGLAMDRVPGGGWSCPGILADGRACGLELDPAGREQQR